MSTTLDAAVCTLLKVLHTLLYRYERKEPFELSFRQMVRTSE